MKKNSKNSLSRVHGFYRPLNAENNSTISVMLKQQELSLSPDCSLTGL